MMEQQSRVILYIRLSKEDGEQGESNSVGNQRDLIQEYVKHHADLMIVSERVDDGYSGVTFDRPGFLAMISDLRDGKADCVIVKDLSRFGRNYIEVGRYLEQIFPIMGIRFVAINDQIDTAKDATYADGILVPFKNLMNDAYCRDISIKIRTQLAIRKKRGDFVAAFAPFGYRRSQTQKHKLEIDPVAADIVKMIFRARLAGHNNHIIAKQLNDAGLPAPSTYKNMCNIQYKTPFQQSIYPQWTHTAVGRILENEVYVGTMVQGKNTTLSYKLKERQEVPKDQWMRVENTHEAIIPKELFIIIQEMMARDTRTPPYGGGVHLLSGMMKCATCGGNMVRRAMTSRGKTYVYFACSTNKNDKNACTNHRISEKLVEDALLVLLRQHIDIIDWTQQATVLNQGDLANSHSMKAYQEILAQKQQELHKYKGLRMGLYEDMRAGLLSQEEYTEMKQVYENLCTTLKADIEALEGELKQGESGVTTKTNGSVWLSELTRTTLVLLVKEIIIHEGGHIQIQFRYGNPFGGCNG